MRRIRLLVGTIILSLGIAQAAQWIRNSAVELPVMDSREAVQAAGALIQHPEGVGEAVAVISQSLLEGNDGVVSVTAPAEVKDDDAH